MICATLALFALLPALVSAVSPRQSYAACIRPADIKLTDLNAVITYPVANSDGVCSNHCANTGPAYQYAYTIDQDSTTEICGCSNTGPTAAMFATAVDPAMTCATGQWNAYISLTTFEIPQCYSGFASTSSGFGRTGAVRVISHDQCFSNCIQYSAATLVPALDGSGYDCYCDSDNADVDPNDAVICAKGVFARYASHGTGQRVNSFPAAPPGTSAWVRRRLREQERMDSQINMDKVCPANGKACLLGKGLDAYECIDTDYELESCGGCVNGVFNSDNTTESAGIDCTALPGVSMGGVSCTHGQCAIWACDPDFELKGRECVPVETSTWKLVF